MKTLEDAFPKEVTIIIRGQGGYLGSPKTDQRSTVVRERNRVSAATTGVACGFFAHSLVSYKE